MTFRKTISLATLALAGAFASGCVTPPPAAPITLAGQPCTRPPAMKCPDENCGALVVEQGPVQSADPERRYFLDYPCDLKPGEKVTPLSAPPSAGLPRSSSPFVEAVSSLIV